MEKKALEIDHAFSLINHWTQSLPYKFDYDDMFLEERLQKTMIEHKEIDFKESVLFEHRNKEIMENIEKAILKEDEKEKIHRSIEAKQSQKIIYENRKVEEKKDQKVVKRIEIKKNEEMKDNEEKINIINKKVENDEKKIKSNEEKIENNEDKMDIMNIVDTLQLPILEQKKKEFTYNAMDRVLMYRKKIENKRKITPKCGQLTNSKQQIARITKDLEDIIMMSREVSTTVYHWVLNFLSKAVIKQAETEVTVNLYSAYPLAAVCVFLMSSHPDLVDILLARFAKKCPYTIPYLKYNKNTEEGMKALGFYRSKNGKFEEEASYTERQCGIFAVFAAIIQTQHIPNYLPMHFGWTLLAKLLNEPPSSETVFAIISTFMDISGNVFVKYYGLQADKLIRLAVKDWVGDNKGSNATRLKILGEEWITQKKIGLKNGGYFEE
ncbi:hypothetical protein PMAC_001287 [Pneumocystis sp. 'macacae']|nr:hypothetical protein PMAC_001287 [Pneumocystis sp. 'macacae']